MRTFSEATRVQMPAMVHLTRIGYSYYGRLYEESAGKTYDPDTNILLEVFAQQFQRLNPGHEGEYSQVLRMIKKELNDDDLGRGFYKRLQSVSPIKLIDYDCPDNNTFHFTAELPCRNGQEEFRPDITLFVNGLPLCFVEVKKPNNYGGIIAESKRMNGERFPKKHFRRFINITQLMIFSNNMEYDTIAGVAPVQGAFYCTGARHAVPFNCFREDHTNEKNLSPFHSSYPYRDINPAEEKRILTDYNCQVIHNHPEYKTNLHYNTPTNRILTSMCSPTRLLFLLRYGIAYVTQEREVDGKLVSIDEKHIMRYQQLFAAMAIQRKLAEGITSGVIWHTQGSGKTALAFYLTHVLTDFYARQDKVAKFYFIVDRLDLLEQATQEFEARGLAVATANSREELMAQFRSSHALEGASGQMEITVVNIQRFAEDKDKLTLTSYATNLQRIFILDEAHRGYRPGGCFLANLFEADKSSVKIALTGTPLLAQERASCKVFGNYLHTYYYDRSIIDGYTLKIIREDIETSYKESLTEVYDKLQTLVEKRDVTKADIIEHPNYVSELARYIRDDLKTFRKVQGDNSLGGMVICETSEQARRLYDIFRTEWDTFHQKKQMTIIIDGHTITMEQSSADHTTDDKRPLHAGLILYDTDDKDTRRQVIHDFKKSHTIDILIVYNMLLTGFDAPRLKRLYFGRKLKDHTLLQAITRVNRPYQGMRYGYIIDFADIKRNFDTTNEAYLKELMRFNDEDQTGQGNSSDMYHSVMESKDTIMEQMNAIRRTLFDYTCDNAEEFTTEISAIDDKDTLMHLRTTLIDAKNIANVVRTYGDDELRERLTHIDLTKLPELIKEVQHRIDTINLKETFKSDTKVIINEAMLNIEFAFKCIGEEELDVTSCSEELHDKWRRTVNAFIQNIDHDDIEYITLLEAFHQRFGEHGFVISTKTQYDEEIKALNDIISRLQNIERKNNNLVKKYSGDVKFARVHKRIQEENNKRQEKQQQYKPMFSLHDDEIMVVLRMIKQDIDQKVYNRNDILKKDAYFNQTVNSVISECLNGLATIHLSIDDFTFVQTKIAQQYINQYNDTYPRA